MRDYLQNYVHVPDMLGIKTNVSGFRWGFGACNVVSSEEEFDCCKFKVYLEAKNDRDVFNGLNLGAYSEVFRDFRAIPQGRSVLFEKKAGPVWLRFLITLQENRVHVVVGKSYLRLVKYKLMYIHPISYIIFDVVSMLFLQHNLTTLYCSSVCLANDRSAVFVAAPNTGKSLTALQLQNLFHATIIAEDMAISDGETIWGAPHTGLFRNYHDSVLQADNVHIAQESDGKHIDAVFVLQKCSTNSEIEDADCLDQLLLINRYSLGYYYSPCVRVLDYYNSDISVSRAMTTEHQLLERMVCETKSYIVKRQSSIDFAEYVNRVMC